MRYTILLLCFTLFLSVRLNAHEKPFKHEPEHYTQSGIVVGCHLGIPNTLLEAGVMLTEELLIKVHAYCANGVLTRYKLNKARINNGR